MIRLTGKRHDGILLCSIRARRPYIAWQTGKGPKASLKATHSAFDLALSKHLRGSKLLECTALPKERTAILWFTGPTRLGLILSFIPAAPEAFLVSIDPNSNSTASWRVIARSRTKKTSSNSTREPVQTEFYQIPDGSGAPLNPLVRSELVQDAQGFYPIVEKSLQREAFEVRLQSAEKALKSLHKQAKERYRHSESALLEASKEPNWQYYGDLMKASLHLSSGASSEANSDSDANSSTSLIDYATGTRVEIPRDPQLTAQEQVAKFYQNSRRSKRRKEEAQSRMQNLQEMMTRLDGLLNSALHLKSPELKDGEDWKELTKLENLAAQNTTKSSSTSHQTDERRSKKPSLSSTSWLGKSFRSKDGLQIYVGRSKDENLELTFKHTRGNDLWLHVRGRPGAHVVIPLPTGQSVPLDSLLDASTLAIYYSGGAKWGKTEVDYTSKKYVKRIKDSSEVSYTQNKTLLIEPDPTRINRLLSQNHS